MRSFFLLLDCELQNVGRTTKLGKKKSRSGQLFHSRHRTLSPRSGARRTSDVPYRVARREAGTATLEGGQGAYAD